MSEFLSALDVRMLPEMDNQNWMLISPLKYDSDIAKMCIEVPAGFITDFVSFAPLKNLGQRPAVVHDYLYSIHSFPRLLADEILWEALLNVGVDAVVAKAMYDAVRLFGASHKS